MLKDPGPQAASHNGNRTGTEDQAQRRPKWLDPDRIRGPRIGSGVPESCNECVGYILRMLEPSKSYIALCLPSWVSNIPAAVIRMNPYQGLLLSQSRQRYHREASTLHGHSMEPVAPFPADSYMKTKDRVPRNGVRLLPSADINLG